MEGMEYYVYSLEHQMGVPCAIFQKRLGVLSSAATLFRSPEKKTNNE